MPLSSKQIAFLDQLQASVGDVTFIYGQPTISGDAKCVLMLAVEQDEEGRPEYVATITGPHLPGAEAEGLEWRVVDDSGQELHSGKTGRRGQFRFPVDQELASSPSPPTCSLSVAQVSTVHFPEPFWKGVVELALLAAPDQDPRALSDGKLWGSGWTNDRRDIVIHCPIENDHDVTFPYHAALLRVSSPDPNVEELALIIVHRNEQLGAFQARRPASYLPKGSQLELFDLTDATLASLSPEQRAQLLQDPNIDDLPELQQKLKI